MAGLNSSFYFVPETVNRKEGSPPTILIEDGHYKLENIERLNSGAFGTTYKVIGWLDATYRSPFGPYSTRGDQPCCIKLYEHDANDQMVRRNVEIEYQQLLDASGASGHVPMAIARGVVRKQVSTESQENSCFLAIVMEYLPINESPSFCLLSPPKKTRIDLPTDQYDPRLNVTMGRKEKPSPTQTAVFVLYLCKAIRILHDHNVIHHDLKPDNIAVAIDDIVLTPSVSINRAKDAVISTTRVRSVTDVFLLDLGNSAAINSQNTLVNLTHNPHLASFAYGAPEIFDFDYIETDNGFEITGTGDLYKYKNEPSVDTYSVGCIIYYFVEGKPPEHSSTNIGHIDLSAVCQQHLAGTLYKRDGVTLHPWVNEPQTGEAAEIDRRLEALLCEYVRKCTIYEPDKRAEEISVGQIESELSKMLGLEAMKDVSTRLRPELSFSYPTEYISSVRSGGGLAKKPKHFRGEVGAYAETDGVANGHISSNGRQNDGRDEYARAINLLDTNPQEAARLLRSSASKGYVHAYAALGDILATERVDPNSAEEAKEALLAAGRNRNAYAMYRLGKWFETGKNLGRISDKDAMACYSVATDLGDTDAAFELGRMYLEAGKAERDRDQRQDYWNEAYKLFARICKDNPYGYLGLGWIYEYGYGVRINNTTAREMYHAAANADEPVEEAYERLAWPQGTVPRALARAAWGLLTCGPTVLCISYFTLLWIGVAAVVDAHATFLATCGKAGFWLFWGVLSALPLATTFFGYRIGRYGAYRINTVTRLFCVASAYLCMYALWKAGLLPFLPSDMVANMVAITLGIIVGLILQPASR